MANFFPLIANPVGNIIQEMPSGDFLDLSQSGIANSGNITVSGVISATGNIAGGNINTTGLISATGAITGAAITGTSLSVSTGNITGGNLILSGAIVDSAQLDIQTSAANANIVLTPNGTGNVNIGRMSASGNITAVAFYGNGAALTSITGANVTGTVGSATNATNATNSSTVFVGLAAASAAFKIPFADTTVNQNGYYGLWQDSESTFTYNPGTDTLTVGNISGGNISGAGLVSATNLAGTLTTAAQPNITSVGTMSAATITTLSTSSITKTGTSGVGNIGASGSAFDTVFAKATSAQYADLAEKYTADADYEPGTVLIFGGDQEVTMSTADAQCQVVGVVSTNPAYVMNSELEHKFVATVALTGRTPVKVIGPVSKGDFMVSAANGYARASSDPKLGTVIGKAIENFDGDTGVIEVLINNH